MEIGVVSKDGDRVNVVLRNANSIAIFRQNTISIYTIIPAFYRFLCVLLTISHIALNQSAALMILYKPRHTFSHFILATILEKC